MPLIGYHASHEQFPPETLLDLVRQAGQAGFTAAMCSDHFHPWTEAQGHSGHAWTWLGSALQATRLPIGVVNCPIGRYHPAVVAQAAATLTRMHPGRFWLAVGSGEALNEAITGEPWPDKNTRNQRLVEAASAIRALWDGETVTRDGAIQVEHARLYSRPAPPPPLLAAALTPDTARWAGGWADGLITVSAPRERMQRVVDAFRAGGGEGKPLYLQVKLSFAGDEETALAGAMEQWRANAFDSDCSQNLRTPAEFEAAAAHVSEDDLRKAVRISADIDRHVGWLQEDIAAGFDALYLHNVNREQERFVDVFGGKVLPQLG
jgi:coenzyme F420-dependent glucose-6-phosphate dehydrogenase